MRRLLQILESGYASAFCIVFAIANRIIFTTLYSSIGRDTKVQLSYAENLLAGNGLGVTKYYTTNLNQPVFDTYQLFPPGFSFTIIPFLKIFSGNEYNAVLAFDIIAAILFIVAVRLLVKNIGLPIWITNIITLVAGCVQYPFFMSYSSTDVVSVSLVLFAMSAMIAIADKKTRLTSSGIILYGFLFFLPCFFRYMYLPVTLSLPLLIMFYGLFIKNDQLKKTGIKLLISTVAFLIILFGTTAAYSGNAVYVYNAGRGIFMDQVIHWYPFLPASFINLDFAAQQIARILHINYSQVISFFEIINVVSFFLLVFLLMRYFITHKKTASLSRHFIFVISSSILSIAILVMLAYLSLTYKAQDWGNYKWTYNYDVRYFAFIYIFTLLLFFTVVYFYPSLRKKGLMRLLAFLIMLCLAVEVFHGIYYNAKIIMHHKDLSFIRNGDMSYRKFRPILAGLKKQYPDRQIFVCSPDQFYLHTAAQMKCKAIFDYANLNKAELILSAKSVLVLVVHKEDTWIMKEYIQKHKPQLVSTVTETDFFIEEIASQ